MSTICGGSIAEILQKVRFMNDDGPQPLNRRGLLKPTLQITFFSVIGILVSFVTEIIVAAKFGATMARDAYFTAAVVPFYLTNVLLGALTVTFVPIFIEYETKKGKEDAWKVASIFTNLTFLVLFGISLLGFIFARRLISVTAPGFKGVELSLTATLLRIILPSIIFGGLTSLLSSMYYAEHRFLRPAIAPVVSAVLSLLSVVFLVRYWGIKSLAFGHLIGAVVGFLVLVPIFFKQSRYYFSFDFKNEGVVRVIRVMSPLVFAGLFDRSATVIERMIASTLPTGSISYLGYANKITQILGAIATAGISTTIFPVMARGWAENDLAKVRGYFAKGVRIIILLTFPIVAIFTVLGIPMIQVVFQRGMFDHETTVAVANVTLILFIGPLVFGGLGNIVWKGFYISQRTRLSAVFQVILTVIYIGLACVFAHYFSYIGLAAALSVQSALGILVAMIVMKVIYKGINGKQLVDGLLKVLASCFVSMVCVYFCFNLLITNIGLTFCTFFAGTIGLFVYLVFVVYVFKVDEAVSMMDKAIKYVRTRFMVNVNVTSL
jgi:putative peptidoglycan lipid II flippase